jgi:hypothetical protein
MATKKNNIVTNLNGHSGFKSQSAYSKAKNIRQFYNTKTRAQRSDAGKKRK